MERFTMRRISHRAADAATNCSSCAGSSACKRIVVSPRGKEADRSRVFGLGVTPAQVVERICTDVRQKGLSAVLHYTGATGQGCLDGGHDSRQRGGIKAA